MTGRPTSSGRSRSSTAAKNASMSTCSTAGESSPERSGSSTVRTSAEQEPPEALGVEDAGSPALLFGPQAHGVSGPGVPARELAAMALDGGHLHVDRLGDVNPHVGLEGPAQVGGRRLVRRAAVGEIMWEPGGRAERVEQRPPGDSVVPVVEVVLTEEHGGR